MGLKFNNSDLHSSQTVLVFQFSLDYDYAISGIYNIAILPHSDDERLT